MCIIFDFLIKLFIYTYAITVLKHWILRDIVVILKTDVPERFIFFFQILLTHINVMRACACDRN